jgi:hypothetical protein
VSEERSPLKEAMDLRKADQLLLFAWAEGLAADDMITILRRI